ncbi:MAG: hypothetical protein UT32_C0024G0009 [Parcubacteria group bacterium GW2011_GWC2_39_14]|nr:MAG: hypothetical protein UT32_C0024G0009 [Parcubacteria group bacterium GW2011_GWC2_39_14]
MLLKLKKRRTLKESQKGADLKFFDTIFRGIWVQMMPTLGVTNVHSLLEHAQAETSRHYPLLKEVRIKQDGVNLAGFKKYFDNKEEAKEAEKSLWAFLENFTALSSELSGDMIGRQVTQYIQKQEKGRDFGKLLYRTGLDF